MAVEMTLKSAKRTQVGKATQTLRARGVIPGVVYGQGKEATMIQADERALNQAYQEAGTSKLVDLTIEGEEPKTVLFHDVQHDHLGKNIIHFDLYTVKMDEEIQTEVPIRFVGESPVVYEQNAVLLKNLETIEVKALPGNLPENIEVDISEITEMEQSIVVKDLTIPEGVEVLTESEEMVAKAEAPREEEEEEELPPEGAEAAMVEAEHGGEAATEGEEGETGEETGEGKEKGKPEAEAAEKPEPKEEKKG